MVVATCEWSRSGCPQIGRYPTRTSRLVISKGRRLGSGDVCCRSLKLEPYKVTEDSDRCGVFLCCYAQRPVVARCKITLLNHRDIRRRVEYSTQELGISVIPLCLVLIRRIHTHVPDRLFFLGLAELHRRKCPEVIGIGIRGRRGVDDTNCTHLVAGCRRETATATNRSHH